MENVATPTLRVRPSFIWHVWGGIFWDWDDSLCMISTCPSPGDQPIMSRECDYDVYNYGHAWDIVYVKPARAQNAIPLMSSGTVLQDNDIPIEIIDGDDTLTMDQQRDGNFIVRRNGGVIFATASYPDAGSLDYYTKLQGDCNLITFQGTPSDKGDVAWKSDYRIDVMPGEYILGQELDCFLAFNREDNTLSVYVGTPDEVFGELWNSDY